MNSLYTLIIVLSILAATGLILCFVLPYIKEHKVEIDAAMKQANHAYTYAQDIYGYIKPFLKDAQTSVLDDILSAAHMGVGYAEQLYILGELEGEQRKEAARDYIQDALKTIGIEITPEVELLIDGAIEAEVLQLGHAVEQ